MSTEPQSPVEELSREELEERVNELEGVGTAMAMLVNQLRGAEGDEQIAYDDPEFVPVAAKTIGSMAERLEEQENRLDRLESTVKDNTGAPSIDGENWRSVVEKAHELKNDANHGLPANRVKLYRENIAHACEVGKKRGQQLIDEWANEDDPAYAQKGKRGVEFQPYRAATPANNNEKQRKALIVDLDVWEDPE